MAAAALPTAQASVPCDELRPASLDFVLHADADELDVGEVVEVEAQIVHTAGGLAGIPLFRLAGAEPAFAIEDQDSSYPDVEFVRYWLRAIRPGRAELQVSINFETSAGCTDAPLFLFRSARSARYPITVRGDVRAASTPTPTPTMLPAPPWRPESRATRQPTGMPDCSRQRAMRLALLAEIDRSLGQTRRAIAPRRVSIDRLVAAVRRSTACRALTPAQTSAASPRR